jgi:hypothetical protein
VEEAAPPLLGEDVVVGVTLVDRGVRQELIAEGEDLGGILEGREGGGEGGREGGRKRGRVNTVEAVQGQRPGHNKSDGGPQTSGKEKAHEDRQGIKRPIHRGEETCNAHTTGFSTLVGSAWRKQRTGS